MVKGYAQIPGVDYTESFSPVVADITVRVCFCFYLHNKKKGWVCEMIDIEAAFLNADLPKGSELYIEWPEGILDYGIVTREMIKKYCLGCDKAMYGSVQAARAWFLTFIDKIGRIDGLSQSKNDPCLWFKHDKNGLAILSILCYVDDVLLIGDKTEVEAFKIQVQKHYKIAELGQLKKHLGVWYEEGIDEHGEYLMASMKDYLMEIIKNFEKAIGRIVKVQPTPGYPNTVLVKDTSEPAVQQEDYRSIVGQLMYFCKRTPPETSNQIREQSRMMDHPTELHWKAMERLIGYCKSSDLIYTIKYRPPGTLEANTIVDSDWAKDPDERKSVSGQLDFVGDTLVGWWSKGQETSAQSSSESEYVSLAGGSSTNRYVQMVLYELCNRMVRGKLYEDNTGCIFFAENGQMSSRMKHIDIKHHFIRDMLKWGYQRLFFIKSENNASDVCTKNVSEKIHKKFMTMFHDGTLGKWTRTIADREAVKDQDSTPKQEDIIFGKEVNPGGVSNRETDNGTDASTVGNLGLIHGTRIGNKTDRVTMAAGLGSDSNILGGYSNHSCGNDHGTKPRTG